MKTQSTDKTTFRRFSRSAIGQACSLALLSAAISVPLIASPVAAQDPATAAGSQKLSLNLQNSPIVPALKTLFQSRNLNNIIDQDVTGNVNISISDVSFDVELRALLRAANPPLTYDIENGIYHVKVKRVVEVAATAADTPGTTDKATPTQYHIPIKWYDVRSFLQLITQTGATVDVPVNLAAAGSAAGGTGASGGGVGGGGGGGFGGAGGGGFGGGR